jgi:hypothetical protein
MNPPDAVHFLAWLGVFVGVQLAVNVLLAAAAYKINRGYGPLPFGAGEYWLRSLLAGLGATGYESLAFIAAFLLAQREFAWPVYAVLLVVGLFLGIWYYNWAFALDDYLEAFKVLLIHHLLPVFAVVVCVVFFVSADSLVRWASP